MKNFVPSLLAVSIVLFAITSCSDEETFPVTPVIAFKSLEKYQSLSGLDSLVLAFSFTDGDGDIGSAASDTFGRDVYARLFEMNNGVFEEAPLSAPLEYRVPYLEPRGNNSSLKGDIRINIDYNVLRPNDTIYYKVALEDRAGNRSNEISTATIITRIQ
ncbi:MAG: hypothetical protein ACKOKB_07650 [Bacteroidota bacterium]